MKDRLYYVPADDADSDKVAAYLKDAAGNLLTSTLVSGKQSLDVNVTQSALPAGAATEATLASILADTATIDSNVASILADTTAILADTSNIDTNVAAILADTATIDSQTLSIQNTLSALSKAEDSVHASGDQGIQMLAVRQDADSPMAADGDYTPLQTDENGALKVSGDLQANIQAPDTAILATAVAVTDTAAALVTALAGRNRLLIENLGAKSIYVGDATVTDTNGFRVSPGSVLDLEIGPSVSVWAVCSSGQSASVRVLEVA